MKIMLLLLGSVLTLAAGSGETAITDVLHRACRAYQAGDAAALEELLAEDYTLTDSRGKITTRAEDLAEVRAGTARYTLFENRDMRVRLYGDAAVVTGRTHIETVVEGRTVQLVFQFTDTMIRRNGRWQVAASHATRIEAS